MNTDIHRLLDEAFAGVEMTPDAQDLKEEVRANLVARVDELEASGVTPADAARRAISELGDVRELLGDAPPARAANPQDAYLRHRVRPQTGFVVRIVLWSLGVVAGLVLSTLNATGVLPISPWFSIGMLGFASTALGLLVGDSLAQETTTNHPMPESRAGAYALATFLGLYGLGFAGLVALTAVPLWCVVFAALGIVASIVLFAFLGASQTNRHKAWVRDAHRAEEANNRFAQEPETAARFGIYTAVIWILAFAGVLVLGFTVGWWWAPLALVGGFAVMMIVLARMLFGARKD
ncbi:permease prefix domain 1-containing protein [Microbacterium ulmi]|uniref:Uncharacterized protein n=1 Tax=Microbacterium ulmi TaxID=179095 RepID=A0A7Y2LZC4_9MICO|nr:permease prefix domain 1-containing protein [Microbacterium ulmi]NII68768.1 hypothetical protein [Microbacterium ulmi]NNH03575.1 hypothetical protein [Microbacterium ulmi]